MSNSERLLLTGGFFEPFLLSGESLALENASFIQDDEALQSLDAVKNGRVYPIMLSEMYASATRTQDGIETFAKGLYPDVNLD